MLFASLSLVNQYVCHSLDVPLESDELSGICICHSVICENDNNHHGVRNYMKSDMCRRNMRRIAVDLEFL